MSGSDKKLILRCPVCFARETDVVLHRRADNTLYCVKCSFTGDDALVQEMYADLKKKYRLMTTRITMEDLEKM